MYDMAQYDLLLLHVQDCGCTATVFLTEVNIVDREEDSRWPEGEKTEQGLLRRTQSQRWR
jgi:hypothetical protein